jgi:hypothetical protein
MSPPGKRVPRLAGARQERQNSVGTVCEQSSSDKPFVSLIEPAIRLLRSDVLLRGIAGTDQSKLTGVVADCITIAILSAKLRVTRDVRLAQRIRSLIRKMTRDFNRACFDLQRGTRL